eukprot:6479490-Amphidinium_carterae.1
MQTVGDADMFFQGDTAQVPPRLLSDNPIRCSAGGGANGKERVVQTPEEIDDGFKYIQNAGPRNPSDALPWALKQQMFGKGESGDGPLVGWNLAWIKDGLAAKRDAGFLSKEVVDYPLTLMDFTRFALTEIILPVLGDIKTKSVIWAGTSGVGKTPAAHALSNAMSHFWCSEMGLEAHASFKSA